MKLFYNILKKYAPGIFAVIFFLCFFSNPKVQQHIHNQRQKVKFKAKLDMLNLTMPVSYDDLVHFIQSDRKPVEGSLTPYVDYYERVVEYMPQRADGYAMLAFCYYYQGGIEKAILLYQRAIQLNADFFWAFYNLGIIYFNQGEYSMASDFFKKALSQARTNAKICCFL